MKFLVFMMTLSATAPLAHALPIADDQLDPPKPLPPLTPENLNIPLDPGSKFTSAVRCPAKEGERLDGETIYVTFPAKNINEAAEIGAETKLNIMTEFTSPDFTPGSDGDKFYRVNLPSAGIVPDGTKVSGSEGFRVILHVTKGSKTSTIAGVVHLQKSIDQYVADAFKCEASE